VAERVRGTRHRAQIRRECLDHVIVMNAAGLHRVLHAFTNTSGTRQGHAVPASGHTAVNRSHRSQFLPPPPPTLISARYATDFNEVKLRGQDTSGVRTAEETLMAQVHASVNTQIGFFHVWNRVAADIAQRQGLSLIDTARIFALLAVAIHDGLQTSFTSKFTYGLWRPVTAIRRAGEDLNGATDPDPAWTPLLTTPTYPSYAGNAACLSAASARALEIVFGKDPIPFTVTYPRTMGLPTETRTFASFADLAQQQADSRVLGGIHYRFDNEASQAYCVKVPEFTAENFMLPRNQ